MKFFPDFSTFVEIGPLSIQWYAIMILIGAGIAYKIGEYRFQKLDYSTDLLSDYFFNLLFSLCSSDRVNSIDLPSSAQVYRFYSCHENLLSCFHS